MKNGYSDPQWYIPISQIDLYEISGSIQLKWGFILKILKRYKIYIMLDRVIVTL